MREKEREVLEGVGRSETVCRPAGAGLAVVRERRELGTRGGSRGGSTPGPAAARIRRLPRSAVVGARRGRLRRRRA